MKRLLPAVFASLIGFGVLAGFSASAQFEQELDGLQKEWKQLSVLQPNAQQADALRELALKAEKLANRYPDKIEPQIWEAMILNSYAHATGHHHRMETMPEIVERIRVQNATKRSGNSQI